MNAVEPEVVDVPNKIREKKKLKSSRMKTKRNNLFAV